MNFLQQTKLTKTEWDMIEIPVESEKERQILTMIQSGYDNTELQYNPYVCVSEFLHISNEYDQYMFDNVFLDKINKINKKDCLDLKKILKMFKKESKHITNADKIKMKNSLKLFEKGSYDDKLIEFILFKELKVISKMIQKKEEIGNLYFDKKFVSGLYNINFILKHNQSSMNAMIKTIFNHIIDTHIPHLNISFMFSHVSKLLEHNKSHQYQPYSLYSHQKTIYSIFKKHNNVPKFVFYCAPTCSGKTLTPIGLTNEYKVIFVCASKHIGLGLAKSSFSLKKKVGFAFGCNDTSQIRLNYNAICAYKTVGKRKIPDHSDGKLVELMISDISSLEYAILYMKAFQSQEKIILFWDEPTIGLDVSHHELHDKIKQNWNNHNIPNIIFSCATLPKRDKLDKIIDSFRCKHPNAYIDYIETHDEHTNLMIYDEYGNIVMPHMYFKDLEKMKQFLIYQGKKYYKFYNGNQCATFLYLYNKHIETNFIEQNFSHIDNFTLGHIKDCYVKCLININEENWKIIQEKYNNQFPQKNIPNEHIGCDLTTKHASSLTNGPTLYISDNVENICKYLLHITKLDNRILKNIQEKISENSKISTILRKKRKDYEDKIDKYRNNEKIMEQMRFPPDVIELNKEIETLQGKIHDLTIDNIYKPNTLDHYNKWNRNQIKGYEYSDVFSSYVGDKETKQVMQMYMISALYKILLLMGIGVFSNEIMATDRHHVELDEIMKEDNNDYVEVMKGLADQKSLYLIIANSDYIYGTNYQFSHCYLGKDMKNMSQEKIIQCIGRIGRQERNKHFSFRFRSEEQINMLYDIQENSIEAENMNKLFC